MQCELTTQAYKWREGEAWKVGRLVLCCRKRIAEAYGLSDYCEPNDHVLLQESCAGPLVFVPFGELSPYGPPGAERIEEPGK